MLNDIIDPKEVTPDKFLPNLLVVVVISPEHKVDDIDAKSLNYEGNYEVSDKHFGVGGHSRVQKHEYEHN